MSRHKDAAFGFAVWGPMLRCRLYAVQTAPFINIYHGDAGSHGGIVQDTPYGFLNLIFDDDEVDDDPALIGVIVAVMDEKMDPVPYIAAGEVGAGGEAGYVMVADHPDQEFLCQEDCNSTDPIALAAAGQNCNIASQTYHAGTAATGISLMELDSSSVGTSADLQCKLHYPHPEDIVPGTEGTWHPRWVVTLNEHYYGDTMAGTAVGT